MQRFIRHGGSLLLGAGLVFMLSAALAWPSIAEARTPDLECYTDPFSLDCDNSGPLNQKCRNPLIQCGWWIASSQNTLPCRCNINEDTTCSCVPFAF